MYSVDFRKFVFKSSSYCLFLSIFFPRCDIVCSCMLPKIKIPLHSRINDKSLRLSHVLPLFTLIVMPSSTLSKNAHDLIFMSYFLDSRSVFSPKESRISSAAISSAVTPEKHDHRSVNFSNLML